MEAQALDPQQRLLLEVGWRALEDSGIVTDPDNGRPIGVWPSWRIGRSDDRNPGLVKWPFCRGYLSMTIYQFRLISLMQACAVERGHWATVDYAVIRGLVTARRSERTQRPDFDREAVEKLGVEQKGGAVRVGHSLIICASHPFCSRLRLVSSR
jgi:hypothetical protein